MRQTEIAERLTQIDERLARIDERLSRMVSEAEIRQAIQDVFDTLNLVGQLREVESNQRDQLAMLVGLAAELLTEQRDDQAAARAKRETVGDLLIQLRELGRKHVQALYDLERTVEAQLGTREG